MNGENSVKKPHVYNMECEKKYLECLCTENL